MKNAKLLILIMLCVLTTSSLVFAQEDESSGLIEERSRLLEENNINLEDVVSIEYGELETQPHLKVAFGEKSTHTTQAPITFTFTDGSKQVVMDSVTVALSYQEVVKPEKPTENIQWADCTASYSSGWYGTAKSRTTFWREMTTHEVLTHSNWIVLFDHVGYWPWDAYGGLYYITGGPYGDWLDEFTTHHSVYWKLRFWPHSVHLEELVYEMSWAACYVHP